MDSAGFLDPANLDPPPYFLIRRKFFLHLVRRLPPAPPPGAPVRQGLTLVHISSQPESFFVIIAERSPNLAHQKCSAETWD